MVPTLVDIQLLRGLVESRKSVFLPLRDRLGLVLRGGALGQALGEHRHGGVVVQQLEEGDAPALGPGRPIHRRQYPVHRGPQPAVAPTLHDLAQVDREAAWLATHRLPNAIGRQHLQRGAPGGTSRGVMGEDGEDAHIRVRREHLAAFAHREGEEVHRTHVLVRHRQEHLLLAVQHAGEDAEKHPAQLFGLVVVVADGLAKTRQLRLVRPWHVWVRLQREVLLPRGRSIVVALERRLPGHVAWHRARPRLAVLVVFRGAGTPVAGGSVAGCLLSDARLRPLLLRELVTLEEAPGGILGSGDHLRGEPVPRHAQKADVLALRGDGVDDAPLLLLRAAHEGREVDCGDASAARRRRLRPQAALQRLEVGAAVGEVQSKQRAHDALHRRHGHGLGQRPDGLHYPTVDRPPVLPSVRRRLRHAVPVLVGLPRRPRRVCNALGEYHAADDAQARRACGDAVADAGDAGLALGGLHEEELAAEELRRQRVKPRLHGLVAPEQQRRPRRLHFQADRPLHSSRGRCCGLAPGGIRRRTAPSPLRLQRR
mmetsp:Transcript_41031/g.117933  ORF Transcript_41031/g.117933 Transcript_41031/m.117933 type:complete len:540 (+) Transcript_41031:141-1760(+)